VVLALVKTLRCALTGLEQVNNLILIVFAPILYTYSVKVTKSVDSLTYIPYILLPEPKMPRQSFNLVGFAPNILSFGGNFMGLKPYSYLLRQHEV
jgi:hypothetical protein